MKSKFKFSERDIFLFAKERGGFTLTEFLVVMAILFLLVAMLMPSLRGSKESGKMTICLNHQRQIVQAFLLYAVENNSQLPPFGFTDPADDSQGWYRHLKPFLAPAADITTGRIGELDAEYGFRCPFALPSDQDSYGVNLGINPRWVFAYYSSNDPIRYPGSKFLYELSSHTMLIADSRFTLFYKPNSNVKYHLDVDWDGDGIMDSSDYILNSTYASPYNCLQPRHSGRSLVAGFVDGSCRKISITDWAQNKDGMWGP